MVEIELKANSSEDEAELIRVIKFIKNNPESKRSDVKCAEHGEGHVVITDYGPGKSIVFTGCCDSAIDKMRDRINSVWGLGGRSQPE